MCVQQRHQTQELEPLPEDWRALFDGTLFNIDLNHVPRAIKLYSQLAVKKQALTLIPPHFETPLPPLQPAVFPPIFRELAPIPLELFDLDEALASPQVHLNRLANRCLGDTDPEVFVREAGAVVGLNPGSAKPAKVGASCCRLVNTPNAPGRRCSWTCCGRWCSSGLRQGGLGRCREVDRKR